MLPALLGDSPTGRQHVIEYSGRVAIRVGQWKLISGPGEAGAKRGPQSTDALYNLSQDPAESVDVAAEHPEKLNELTTLLRQIRDRGTHSALTP